MSKGNRSEIDQLITNHEFDVDAVLRDAMLAAQSGYAEEALSTIELVAQSYDRLLIQGMVEDDSETRYFDFSSPIEEEVWKAHNPEPRALRQTDEPFSQVYYLRGAILFELGRHEEAVRALEKACRWNPANPTIRFEIGENYKQLHDMDSYARVLDEMYPYIASPDDLARFHRSKAFLLIEREQLRLAAAHLLFSMFFGDSELATEELAYIKEKHGDDYTDMSLDDAFEILQAAGEPCTADGKTLGTLYSLLSAAMQDGDINVAGVSAINLYRLTGDEQIGELARKLVEIAERNADSGQ